ncbi:MAG: hypothetical protein KKC51_04095, partial [Verrucomicrobia bacterium]|nr:hypothetical protein [Verrucomicrobiota bacterium]
DRVRRTPLGDSCRTPWRLSSTIWTVSVGLIITLLVSVVAYVAVRSNLDQGFLQKDISVICEITK